jgi:VIT1/CCC1 family predicted Fe2+/Mn2+ transporter/rubrerythrin
VSTIAPPSAAVARLKAAWRGEIEAQTVYTILAERMHDQRRGEVIREIAAAEGRHRERIEKRLRELGQEIPDPSTVQISPWLRLQARLAPVTQVLRHMESAEKEEITDRYKRSTGDPDTDAVLSSIRVEEQGHSRSLDAIQAAHVGDAPASGVQGRLNRILGRETWHRTGSGWISGAIYGANDGLAAVFGIVAGVSGATGGSSFVLTAGLFGAIASALSMATGAFLAERSTNEVDQANVEGERKELIEHPEEEKEELSLFYQLKGLSKSEADQLADRLAQNQETMLKVLVTEELGVSTSEAGNPVQSAVAAGLSTFVGAMIPVLPFFWLRGTTAVVTAAVISLFAHFLVGAAKSLFTLRSWWAAGLEMTAAGVIVGGITYALGLFLR